MESSQEQAETKLESQTEKFDLRQNAFILEHLLEEAELQWKETKNELEGVLTKGKLKGDEKSPEYLASKIELMRDKAKVECLLEQMKSVKDERNLESQRCKKRLSDNMEKAEFILQEMKSMLEEGLRAPGLEMPLEEQISKSELLLEEIELAGVVEEEEFVKEKGFLEIEAFVEEEEFVEEVLFKKRFIYVVVKSPVLKMQLKKHIVKVESLLQNMKFVHEESKEDAVELKFLLREMKFAQESGKVKSSSLTSALQAYVVKLKLLLDETELEKEKEELGSQMLEKELLEELTKEGFLLMKCAKRLPIMDLGERHLERILSILREMKSEHKGEELKPQVLEVILEQKEKEEHATTSKSPEEKMKLVQEESDIKSPALRIRLKECIVQLDGVLKKEQLKILKEKLKFQKLKKQLYGHMAEMEPLLEKMKLKRKEEGLRSQALEMELNEDLENLELLLEETKLEERHVAKLKRFIVKAKSAREESKTKSATLEMQFEKRTEELQSLFYKLKRLRWSQRWQIEFMEGHKAKLKFLLEAMNEERLQSRELKPELEKLELLVKTIESERHVEVPESLALKMRLEGHLGKVNVEVPESLALKMRLEGRLGKVKSMLEAMKVEQDEEKPELPAMKVQLKEHIVRIKKIKSLTSEDQLKKRIMELKSLQNTVRLFTRELKFQKLEMELYEHTGKLESLLEKEIKLEVRESRFRMFVMDLEKHIEKSESLLNKLECECDVGILQPLVWKMILKKYLAKEKSVLEDIKVIQERKLKSPTLEIELKEHIAKLESLIVEIKLEQEEGLESQMLNMELEEHVVKSELLRKERELLRDLEMLKSPLSKIQLEENIEKKLMSQLKTMKLEREKFAALETKLKTTKLKTRKQALDKLMGTRYTIAIGGRDQDGQSRKSVEGCLFLKGRWVALPAMNIPRSFMSSVVIGNEIVVSGGDTGDSITDTIEVLNLAETPLRWTISPAKLPVPLSAHQTVVYKGKLIVIGGHNGNEGTNSNRIYEILLTPPYSIKILKNLVSPVAWHGAELVGHEIIILGGESTLFVTTSAVFAYNLVRNTLHERQSLPRAIKGMATVTRALRVAVIGGLGDNDQELDEVFMYDPWSGERHILPKMNVIRGPCSAVVSLTLDTSDSCSSDASSDTLVVLGCPSSPNMVEGCNFDSRTRKAMPPTIEAREFCSVVATPIKFKF